MKLSYTLQLKDLCILMFFGFFVGILYSLINIPTRIKKNLLLQIIIDILFSILCSFIFLILINIINQGELRFFLLIGYVLGFIIERITLGKLFAKGYQNMYNLIVKVIKKLYHSRIGRIIFK